jgi:hypothetical protein
MKAERTSRERFMAVSALAIIGRKFPDLTERKEGLVLAKWHAFPYKYLRRPGPPLLTCFLSRGNVLFSLV